MADALDVLDDDERGRLVRAPVADGLRPMLATLTDERFSRDDWIYERKLDGVRCLVHRDGRGARLVSRNGKSLDAAFPELVDAVTAAVDERIVADGEVVAFRGAVTSFAELQQRIGLTDPDDVEASDVAVFLYLFDVLHLGDHDTTRLPLRARKKLLRAAMAWQDPLRFTPHRNRDGEAYFAEACGKGWEGVLAKRADSTYAPGTRSRDWLKFKCAHGQEFVLCGYTEPRGGRVGFGALVLGYRDAGSWRYAGRVGTGFDDALLESLHARLERLETGKCPFPEVPRAESGEQVHWVAPRLVGEVGFTEWTDDGRLRHPRFLGLRPDKAAGDVVRERPRAGGEDG